MSLLIVSLDNTVLNVALPSMQKEFGASVSGMQWTIDAYTLVLASLLMLAGSTADRIGRRRIFKAGLVIFTVGSVLCSVAPNLESLIAFRMVQAVGGSMLNPVAMSIITNTFTEPRERARAIGVWGGVVGISMAAGPIVGGVLVDSVGWRSIFWINLPVGLAALLLTMRYVPESRAPKPRRPDPVGQLLVMTLLGSLTYAIIEAPAAGWTSPVIVTFALLALAALVGLIAYEPRRDEPLIDLRFFRSAPFSGATVIAISAFASLGGFLFLSTLYLQNVRGLNALDSRPVDAADGGHDPGVRPDLRPHRRQPRPQDPAARRGHRDDGERRAVRRVRGGDVERDPLHRLRPVRSRLRLRQRPHHQHRRLGHAPRAGRRRRRGRLHRSRQIGQTLGVAVIGAVLASGIASGVASGVGTSSYATTFVDASRGGWWIIVGCGLAVLLVGLLTSGRWARATAERTARCLEQPEIQQATAGAKS